jgi:hypothetical protein
VIDQLGFVHLLELLFRQSLAAMVREIDGNPYPFPASRAILDSLMDNLDDDGFAALLEANSKLNAQPDGGDDETEIDRAKKS